MVEQWAGVFSERPTDSNRLQEWLADTPQPLYRLLVLATLLSARIRADIAVAAAHESTVRQLRQDFRRVP